MNATIRRAAPSEAGAISDYLVRTLRGGGPERYRRVLDYTWLADKPDLGVIIEDGGQVRGFLGALYSDRDGTRHCNLTSIAVDEPYRGLTLKAFSELLRNKDVTYTCFSASDEVAKILEFFKFQRHASERVLVAPISGLSALRHLRIRVRSGERALETLSGAELALARDHARYRCAVLSIEHREARALAIAVRRGRGQQAFADVLYASDHELVLAALPHLHIPLFRALGTVLTGLDARWVRDRPWPSVIYRNLRPIHVRSRHTDANRVDSLYSELVALYA